MSDDLERYDTPTQRFSTNIFCASVLPGWRIKRGNVEIKIFAGPALESHALKPDVPTDTLHGSHFGARVATELWWEPPPAMIVAAAASAPTMGSEYSARAAAGWRFLDRFWAGPEVANTGLAPLTAFKTGTLEWSVGSGFVEDSFHRSGIYGRIGVLTRQ